MILNVDSKQYDTRYFAFFRKEIHSDFEIWNMRLPSGNIEEVIVFEIEDPLNCLKEYMEYLIREFFLEDDDALTPKAVEFKKDLQNLIYEKE